MKTFRLIMILLIVVLCTTVSYSQTNETQKSATNNPQIQSGNAEISKTVAEIRELLKNKIIISKRNYDEKENEEYNEWGTPTNLQILEDRIEFKFKKGNIIYYYSDLIVDNITTIYSAKKDYGPDFGKKFIIYSEVKGEGVKLIEKFILLQKQIKENFFNSQLALFNPTATQYRLLKTKPAISEEQRKFIIQANMFNQEKSYDKAIEMYNKAVNIDQTSYPAAYSNLALLSAQLLKYHEAIYNMKKYLLLDPEASDARSCQDKIYEWEAKIGK